MNSTLLTKTKDGLKMDNKDQGGAQNTNSGAEGENNNPENKNVSYDTYRRAISDLKKFQEKYNEANARLEKESQDKLESSGKLQEALDAYKKKYAELETSAKKKQELYLYNTLKAKVREKAAAMGCINPDALLKLSKFDDVKVGEDFEIDSEQVKVALEKSVKDYPFLFKKDVPGVKDITPSNKVEPAPSNDLNTMSLDKLTQMLAEQLPR